MQHRIRRWAALAGAAALATSVTACTTGAGGPGTSRETVTLSVSTLENPYFRRLRAGAREAASAYDVELEVVAANDSEARQARQLGKAARRGSEAVLVVPVDSTDARSAVQPLLRADVPVVAVDREIAGADVASTVTSVNAEGGHLAAEAVVTALEGRGQVIHLQGDMDTSAARERSDGFTQALAPHEDVEVVAEQPADFDKARARRVTAALVRRYPEVDAIFAANDQMALGAIQALGERAGEQVHVVGYDGTARAVQAVADGTMHATVAQLPELIGQAAVEQAVTAIDGGQVAPTVPVGVQLVTAGNVAEHL